MTYAFAAAGTGGHVYPALAVADALVADGVSRDHIVFFGGDRMEATTVPAAGYPFVQVPLRGLKRSLSLSNLTIPAVVRRATAQITAAMVERRTSVMTVFGGYVSVPAAIAGRRTGAAVFLHEQNADPGLANRFVASRLGGGRGVTSFVAFPAATRRLKRAEVVGNPLRADLAGFDRTELREAARRRYDLPADVTVLGVVGGSLGARVLNEVTVRIADGVDPERTAIVHLTGTGHGDSVTPLADRSATVWRVHPFESEMQYFYAASDLVLSRGGALTISELAATGTPAVVVPLVEHQAANAAYLADAGGVVIVSGDDIDRVPVEVEQLLVDDERRLRMGAANRSHARPDAAAVMARALRKAAHD